MIEQKILQAANELEDIAVLAKTICNDLRDGKHAPYARVYWLRRRLSKVVASLGGGVPAGLSIMDVEYKNVLQSD